ncbi:MAG: transposase [Simkania sp.]|nr:transposase [Simkania sp.]
MDYRRGGRPLKYSKRQMINAIFYVAKTGCQWGFLPKDYPPWRRAYNNFRKWQKADVFERLIPNATNNFTFEPRQSAENRRS